MNVYKRVLTIAGSDSGGGAGIQADIKTISACGCYAASAITAITAQNTIGVQVIEPMSGSLVEQQICSVLDDIGANAIKIGMLGSTDVARAVARTLLRYSVQNVVLDPVLVATSGDELSVKGVIDVIVNELMPLCSIITPNLIEAERLTGSICVEKVWTYLSERGCRGLLLKGGHKEPNAGMITDFLVDDKGIQTFVNEWIITPNTHGTGCSLSSSVAAFLAHGLDLNESVERAEKYLHQALATAADYSLGHGAGPVHHFYKFW
ncbi:MAG: bifunctional hydroxymethylpyrimidine kinase/phosphomethylpyrimidine kinase [Mucinivorans sp.]